MDLMRDTCLHSCEQLAAMDARIPPHAIGSEPRTPRPLGKNEVGAVIVHVPRGDRRGGGADDAGGARQALPPTDDNLGNLWGGQR